MEKIKLTRRFVPTFDKCDLFDVGLQLTYVQDGGPEDLHLAGARVLAGQDPPQPVEGLGDVAHAQTLPLVATSLVAALLLLLGAGPAPALAPAAWRQRDAVRRQERVSPLCKQRRAPSLPFP